MRKLWISFGVVNAAVAASYFAQRPVDDGHICRAIGADLDLSPPAKLINFVGSKYRKFTGKHLLSFDLEKICTSNGVDIEKEAFLLSQPWSPSPLVDEKPSNLVEQHSRFLKRFEQALNHEEAPFSPVGRLTLKHSFETYQKNRFVLISSFTTYTPLLTPSQLVVII